VHCIEGYIITVGDTEKGDESVPGDYCGKRSGEGGESG